MATGLIFNVQKYSLHDGPGIRTTVFLKGCPLECAWCHNPESMSHRREILVVENRCLTCGSCRRACPQAQSGPVQAEARPSGRGRPVPAKRSPATKKGTSRARPEPAATRSLMMPDSGVLPSKVEHCQQCGACIEACPTSARRFVGRRVTVNQLLELVEQDRVFYELSGGGVTFSGGEPFRQFGFLRAALQACHERQLHTAVDTCGFARQEDLLAIAPLTGLFLYDVKMLDEAKHRRYTGVSNERILSNLQALGARHERIWLRVPVIPGINDSERELEELARLAAGLPSVRQVNLLPYHRTGLPKARRLGRTSPLAEVQPPSAESMRRAAALFASFGLAAIVGG